MKKIKGLRWYMIGLVTLGTVLGYLTRNTIAVATPTLESHEVATANGLTGMAAWSASTMFALIVGALADTLGFGPLFAVLAVMDLLAAVTIWGLLSNKPLTGRAACPVTG